MAHKKGVGSTDNGRDSNSKRLGIKIFGGQSVIPGNILVRQRGTKFHPGNNVYMGRDHTLHAAIEGTVQFTRKKNNRTYINILPSGEVATVKPAPKAAEAEAAAKAKAAEEAKAKAAADAAAAKAKAAKPAKAEPAAELSEEEKSENKSNLLSSIGEASEADKDDLKKIKGVGPKLEGTLNSLGIFTFEQVSKMSDKEYALVDSLLDGFKGRAKRDDWAGQANDFK